MGDTEKDTRRQYRVLAEFLERLAAVTSNKKERHQLLNLVASYRGLAQQHHNRQSRRTAA
jgi:hypothetical protein